MLCAVQCLTTCVFQCCVLCNALSLVCFNVVCCALSLVCFNVMCCAKRLNRSLWSIVYLQGLVYVKCATCAAAGRAFRSLHGSWFDGRLVTVKFIKLSRFHARYPHLEQTNYPLKPTSDKRVSTFLPAPTSPSCGSRNWWPVLWILSCCGALRKWFIYDVTTAFVPFVKRQMLF